MVLKEKAVHGEGKELISEMMAGNAHGEAELPCANSNTRGEALRCRARRGRVAPAVVQRHLHFVSVPGLSRRSRAEAGGSRGRKPDSRPHGSGTMPPHCVPQASVQHTGEKGVHGGKSKVSPVLHVRCVLRKTKHIPSGWQCALRRADTVSNADTDGYGKVRINTDWGTGSSESHVLRKFHSTWLCVLLVGKVHCAKPILRAKKWDL